MEIVIYNEHIFYRINLCNVRHVECFFFKLEGDDHIQIILSRRAKKKQQQKTKKPRISKLSNSKSVAGRLLRERVWEGVSVCVCEGGGGCWLPPYLSRAWMLLFFVIDIYQKYELRRSHDSKSIIIMAHSSWRFRLSRFVLIF